MNYFEEDVDVKIILPDVGDFVSVVKLRDGTLVNRWDEYKDVPNYTVRFHATQRYIDFANAHGGKTMTEGSDQFKDANAQLTNASSRLAEAIGEFAKAFGSALVEAGEKVKKQVEEDRKRREAE